MQTLKALIREGEHTQQDFKFCIDDTRKIARTLAAFANTEGGRLLIGVKDNGKIAGVNPEEEMHMITAAAEMHCKPVIPFTWKVWQEDMKLVLEINIEKAQEPPVFAPDEEGKLRVYIRRNDHTLLANKILLQVWKLQKHGSRRPEKIGEDESRLLGLVNEHEPTTLSKLYRLSPLKKNDIDRLLALFICWELVQMEITESGTFYSSQIPS